MQIEIRIPIADASWSPNQFISTMQNNYVCNTRINQTSLRIELSSFCNSYSHHLFITLGKVYGRALLWSKYMYLVYLPWLSVRGLVSIQICLSTPLSKHTYPPCLWRLTYGVDRNREQEAVVWPPETFGFIRLLLWNSRGRSEMVQIISPGYYSNSSNWV